MKYLEAKKRAFMGVAGKIKGFLRTVSGSIPLSLSNVADSDSIISYTLSGGVYQGGTPTPEEPIGVECVGDLVEDSEDINYGKYKIPIKCLGQDGQEAITNIYLDAPLRKIGEYADYIDFESQKVVRKIATDYISIVSSKSSILTNYHIFLSVISEKPYLYDGSGSNRRGFCMSDKFVMSTIRYGELSNYSGIIQPYITSANANVVAYTFNDTETDTIDKAQEKIGDGFYVYYVLETAKEENVKLPPLKSLRGTITYSAKSKVNPSNLSITYYSSAKGE